MRYLATECCLPLTVIDRSKILLYEITSEEDYRKYASVTGNKDFQKVQIPPTPVPIYIRKPGWARRTAYGAALGVNTAQLYKDDILEFFNRELADRSKKMALAIMREKNKTKIFRPL